MKILVIGPSDTRSKGGMATVISDMRNSEVIEYDLDFHESYIDGSFLTRLLFSIYAFIRFLFIQNRYDAFHIHVASKGSTFRKMYYLNAIKRKHKKAIIHIHGANYVEFYDSLSVKQKRRVREFLKSADMVIALSDEWKSKFEKLLGLKNCEALPNGINTDLYRDAVSYDDPNAFAMLGRLGERKGSYILVEATEKAVRENPSIKVVMAGDGEIEKVRQCIIGLEDHISLPGWIDSGQKLDVLKNCSILILPSYHEGLPMAILEGMAAGKAVISTTVGAIPEVIEEENGILVEPGDADALADAMLKLAGNTDLIKEMGRKNIEKTENEFSVRTMHKRLNGLYARAFDGHDNEEHNSDAVQHPIQD